MDSMDVENRLQKYIAATVLDGKDMGLNRKTPLLEWGIINSLEIMKLIAYVRNEFKVSIPAERVVADSFHDIEAIASLVCTLGGGATT
jgi:acyl carrier protein